MLPDDPDMPLDNPDQPDAEEDETVVPPATLEDLILAAQPVHYWPLKAAS